VLFSGHVQNLLRPGTDRFDGIAQGCFDQRHGLRELYFFLHDQELIHDADSPSAHANNFTCEEFRNPIEHAPVRNHLKQVYRIRCLLIVIRRAKNL